MRNLLMLFCNSPKSDIKLFLHHLRAVLDPRLRPKDDLSLLAIREYDDLLGKSVETVREILGSCDKKFTRFPMWRLWNGGYESMDAHFYYSLLRRTKPRQIIEVGGGNSTWIAAYAISQNEVVAAHTVIAPDLSTSRIPPGVVYFSQKVEDVPVDRFETLRADDILFIDSSHTTAEALYHVREILPRLQSGVLVHHHDIYYPYVIPPYLQPSSEFGENDVILQFYQSHQDSFQVLAGLAFARSRMSDEELLKLVPSMRWNLTYCPGALWARRR